jgi:hypothetical protein
MNEPRAIEQAWGRLPIALAFAILTLAPFAHAEEPAGADRGAEARHRYELGTQAFSQKLYAEAAAHFEAAAALKSNAIALYTAATAWDLAPRSDRAADDYARSLDLPGLDAKQTSMARDRLAALEQTVGTLVVVAPDGWKVGLDTASNLVPPGRLHASPGLHELRVQAPDRPAESRQIMLEAGGVKRVELKDEPKNPVRPEPSEPAVQANAPGPPAQTPSAPDEFWSTSRAVGVGVLGASLATFGATAVLGISANDARDSYVARPSRPAFDHASSLQTWTNVSLVTGITFLAGGVALLVWPIGKTTRRVDMRATPGGCIVGGTF